jgi:glutamyl-tRNA reductase
VTSTVRGSLMLIGLSHRTASVSVRERVLAGAPDASGTSIEHLREAIHRQWGPAIVLSTCNRLEVYCWTGRPLSAATAGIVQVLAAQAGVAPDTLRPHLYVHTAVDAAHHLIRVAAGLDSLALGESQILGQVRDAWLAAIGHAPVGPALDILFRRAIEAARRIRRSGAFDRQPSVATFAVAAASTALGTLGGRGGAVLGAGATGKAATRALVAAGADPVTLLNRSPERAIAALEALGLGGSVRAESLDRLPNVLVEADAVICATAAASQIISAEVVTAALAQRHGRPLVLVDIAVPRDVDPAVRDLPHVELIDLDDLAACRALDIAAQRRALDRAEAEAREAAEACMAAVRAREGVPDIVALRRRAEAVREAELRRFARRLGHLAPEERAALDQLTRAIVQKLLHSPTVALREATATGGATGRHTRAVILSAFHPERDAALES